MTRPGQARRSPVRSSTHAPKLRSKPPVLPTHLLLELRRLAESAARLGGQLAHKAFGRRQQVRLKADASEVSAIDVAVEKAVTAHLLKGRPHDAVIGEEDTVGLHGKARPDDGPLVCWVIDPIDGTRNYIRGVSFFSCSVAAMVDGWPVAAAVSEPVPGLIYSAALGQGAQRNGERIRIDSSHTKSAVRSPALVVAIPSAWRDSSGPWVERLVRKTVVRSLGAATLHLLNVVSGAFDASLLNNTKLWDFAAAGLVVTEAGGVMTRPDGGPIYPLDPLHCRGREVPSLAAAPPVHRRLLKLLRG